MRNLLYVFAVSAGAAFACVLLWCSLKMAWETVPHTFLVLAGCCAAFLLAARFLEPKG